MEISKPIVRHVFHLPTSGEDRVQAWQACSQDPLFVWGASAERRVWSLFGGVKRRFRQWCKASSAASLTIYHDGAGVDLLGPLDGAPHKVLFLSTWYPRWPALIDWNIRCTGKLLVGDPDQLARVREHFAWIPERYTAWMAGPRLPPLNRAPGGKGPMQRLGIWLHGESWHQHGNRLRAWVDRWDPADGQVEVIASGRGQPAWARKPWLIWNIDLPLDFALQRLATWDSTLLLQNYALDRPWLQCALALGCFPLVPADEATPLPGRWHETGAPAAYPWGDLNAARSLLLSWREGRTGLAASFENWASGAEEPFLPRWHDVCRQLMQARPPALKRKRAGPGWLPVRWVERLQRLRAGL